MPSLFPVMVMLFALLALAVAASLFFAGLFELLFPVESAGPELNERNREQYSYLHPD